MNDQHISRLRKSGMIRAAIAMATVAAATAPMTANAKVVYFAGGQSNASGNVTISVDNVPVFDLKTTNGKGTFASIGNFQNSFGFISTYVSGGFNVTKLAAGATVDSFSNYTTSKPA